MGKKIVKKPIRETLKQEFESSLITFLSTFALIAGSSIESLNGGITKDAIIAIIVTAFRAAVKMVWLNIKPSLSRTQK